MTTHIATLGREAGHVFSAFKIYRIDKLVLLTSKEFVSKAREVSEKAEPFRVKTIIEIIDPFSTSAYPDIINKIIEYTKMETSPDQVYVNITGGTNLMSSAALTAAQFTGTNAYYVMRGADKDEVLEVPILKISLKDALSEKQKSVFKVLYQEIKTKGDIRNINAFSKEYDLYKQKMNFYLKQFEKLGIVEVDRKGRENTIRLTQTGELLRQFL